MHHPYFLFSSSLKSVSTSVYPHSECSDIIHIIHPLFMSLWHTYICITTKRVILSSFMHRCTNQKREMDFSKVNFCIRVSVKAVCTPDCSMYNNAFVLDTALSWTLHLCWNWVGSSPNKLSHNAWWLNVDCYYSQASQFWIEKSLYSKQKNHRNHVRYCTISIIFFTMLFVLIYHCPLSENETP